jgi:hypothetical protein
VQPGRHGGVVLLHQIVRLGPSAGLQVHDDSANQATVRLKFHHFISPLLTFAPMSNAMPRPDSG